MEAESKTLDECIEQVFGNPLKLIDTSAYCRVSKAIELAELYASQSETVQLKAEDMLKTYESFNYSEDNLDETHYYHDNVILAMKEYARIQIEKDRVSESELMITVRADAKDYDTSERVCFLEGAETVLRQLRYRPINLD